MATWIAHLRIAENILKSNYHLDRVAFVSGNIAPDAGVPNEDWSSFTPPPVITHWLSDQGEVRIEDFYNQYVLSKNSEDDVESFSFVLGYYVHLLSDIEWSKFYSRKKEEALYKENLERDPNFIWRIKEDWYGQDFVYLKNNPNSIFFTCFRDIYEVNDYLDYFPKGAFTNRFKYIREMYLNNYQAPQREFIYLTAKEMDLFVEDTSNLIRVVLDEKAIEGAYGFI